MSIEPLDFIKPFGDKLYVTIEEKATKIGLIELSENARMRSQIAIVQALGEEVKGFNVGDRILVTFHAGIDIQLPETYSKELYHRIINDHEILAKIKYKVNPDNVD